MAAMQRQRRLSSFLGECSSCTSSFASRCKSQASLVYCSDCESLDGYIIDVELPLSSPPNISTLSASRQQVQKPDPRNPMGTVNTNQERYTTNTFVPASQLRSKDKDHVVIDMSGMTVPERTSAPPSMRADLPKPAASRPSCIPAVHTSIPNAPKPTLTSNPDLPRTAVPQNSGGHSIPSLTAAQLAHNLKSQFPSVASPSATGTPARPTALTPVTVNGKAAATVQNNKLVGPKLASLPAVTSPRAAATPAAVSTISLLDNAPATKVAVQRCNTPNRGRGNARSQLLPSLEAQRCNAGTMLVSQRAADALGLNPMPQSQQPTLSAAMRCNTPNRVERAMYVQFSFRNREGPRASQSGDRRV